VRQHGETADILRQGDTSPERVEKQLARETAPVKAPIDGQLAEENDRNVLGPVAPRRFRQELAFDMA
jgi:hypothetical protein